MLKIKFVYCNLSMVEEENLDYGFMQVLEGCFWF